MRLVGYDLYNRPGIVLDAVSKAVDLGTIAMKPLEVGLAEVEVVAQKKQVIYKLDKKVIEASSNLLAGGGSAVDILENTSSIRVDAEGEVSFRGSTGFTVYVDGKPSVFSGTQALEQIPAAYREYRNHHHTFGPSRYGRRCRDHQYRNKETRPTWF